MAILRVRESFLANWNGNPRVFTAGELVDSDDDITKGRGHLFEAVEVAAARVSSPKVERATAAPGEKRSVSPKPAAKK